MSTVEINPLPAELVTPILGNEIFKANPEAAFWLGVVADREIVILPEEYEASGVLRANVYIDEMGFLPIEDRDVNGIESDIDDKRSTHIAVLENLTDSSRVVGTSRLIHKDTENNVLPVEELFSESFSEPAQVGSTEVSRFIARNPSRPVQGSISLSLIRSLTLEAHRQESKYVYAVVERHLANLFAKIGLPFVEVSESRMLDEYNSVNLAIRFEPEHILNEVASDTDGKRIVTHFFGQSALNGALGYYDKKLVNHLGN